MKKLLVYSIALCAFFSCRKKELPHEEYTERVFYINADIDGQAKKLEAGNNDYYMNTSCGRDSNVYYFQGDLAQISYASGRDYAISVIIRDYKVSEPALLVNVDSVLLPGDHLYNTKVIPGKTQVVSFTPEKPNDGNYEWTITDGGSDTRTFNTYSITESFDVGKTYTTTLSYNNFQGNCTNLHKNVFRIGSRLQTTITATRDMSAASELKYNLKYVTPWSGSYHCKWTFENGTPTSVADQNPVTRVFPQIGSSIVKLELFNESDTCVSYYQLDAEYGTLQCHANYTAKFQPIKNNSIFSTVKVVLTDKEGKTYSSDITQPETSYFQIQNSDPYKVNDKGQATRSVKIKFNCLVGDGSKMIAINNAEGVIAVAHQ